MKKLLVICIAAGFYATACNSCQHEPKDQPAIVTQDDTGDSASKMIDTTVDNTMVVNDSTKKAGKNL